MNLDLGHWKNEAAANTARHYSHARPNRSCAYIGPAVAGILASLPEKRVFDLGCGTGDLADYLTRRGLDVTGVDPSLDGITRGREKYPHLPLHLGSSDDPLERDYGTFPAVISIEVIEHIYDPVSFAARLHGLVAPGGIAIVSTPYHGYAKNLLLALSGRMDHHHMPLKVHGHIKFWSVPTLRRLLLEAGFSSVDFKLVGRVRPIAKSMIAIARKA